MTGFAPKVRQLVKARSGDVCEICGAATSVQIHHRRSRGRGGSRQPDTNKASNALHVCVPCHVWVTEHPLLARESGWCVPSYQNPLAVPVHYRRGRLAYLADDGSLHFIDTTVRGA